MSEQTPDARIEAAAKALCDRGMESEWSVDTPETGDWTEMAQVALAAADRAAPPPQTVEAAARRLIRSVGRDCPTGNIAIDALGLQKALDAAGAAPPAPPDAQVVEAVAHALWQYDPMGTDDPLNDYHYEAAKRALAAAAPPAIPPRPHDAFREERLENTLRLISDQRDEALTTAARLAEENKQLRERIAALESERK